MVIFLYRPEYYGITQDNDDNPTSGMAELILAKHRNGQTGSVNLKFIEHLAKFKSQDEFGGFGTHPGTEGTPTTYTRSSKMNDNEDDNTPPINGNL
jgi:replicative DNA helicase